METTSPQEIESNTTASKKEKNWIFRIVDKPLNGNGRGNYKFDVRKSKFGSHLKGEIVFTIS